MGTCTSTRGVDRSHSRLGLLVSAHPPAWSGGKGKKASKFYSILFPTLKGLNGRHSSLALTANEWYPTLLSPNNNSPLPALYGGPDEILKMTTEEGK